MVSAVVTADLSVSAAVRRDIDALRDRDRALADSGLAALALALAAHVDAASSAHAAAACGSVLRDVLARLDELAPAAEPADAVQGLADRARLKLAGRAGS